MALKTLTTIKIQIEGEFSDGVNLHYTMFDDLKADIEKEIRHRAWVRPFRAVTTAMTTVITSTNDYEEQNNEA